MMILLVLSTIGLSQDSTEICLPEEQVRALFEDAQKYHLCEEQIIARDSLITSLEYGIFLRDSTITLLNERIILCEETLGEHTDSAEWLKYLYIAGGAVVTIIIENLTK